MVDEAVAATTIGDEAELAAVVAPVAKEAPAVSVVA
jgi:hypothetical protein